MRSSLLLVFLVGLVAVLLGLLALGVFPPNPTPHAVEKVLPNTSFKTH